MAKGKRRQNRQRLYQIWRYKKRAILCLRCLRIIKRGDIFRTEVFYDDEGAVAADTHVFCSDVRHRPRLRAPARPTVKTISGEPRRKMIMSADTTTTQNSENTDTAVTAEKKPKKTSSSSSKTKKSTPKSTKNKGDKTMSTKKSTSKKTSKKTAKKSAKAEKNGNGNGRSLAVTVGNRLESLMKGNKKAASIIKALSTGKDVSHKQLETLRDEVKTQAATFREKGNGSKASELSAANALVRRLERAAR